MLLKASWLHAKRHAFDSVAMNVMFWRVFSSPCNWIVKLTAGTGAAAAALKFAIAFPPVFAFGGVTLREKHTMPHYALCRKAEPSDSV